MNTNITITLNGSIAPKQSFQLGYKYENVQDTLTFIIPTKYYDYNHYLALQLESEDTDTTNPTILIPLNKVDNTVVFTISSIVTKNAGTYQITFLSTEKEVVDGNIKEANQVFVSNVFTGYIIDNFLTDPVNDESLDPNIQLIYDDLLNLRKELEQKLSNDYYKGNYYYPSLSEDGFLSWELKDGADTSVLPSGKNITGPQGIQGIQGGYYTPSLNADGFTLDFTVSQSDLPAIPSVNLKSIVESVVSSYNIPQLVTDTVKNKFVWKFDTATQTLYITAEETTNGSNS
jgi:hypothetical protein